MSFLHWSGFGILLLGKAQKKHLGDLPPTVPDLPLHLDTLNGNTNNNYDNNYTNNTQLRQNTTKYIIA